MAVEIRELVIKAVIAAGDADDDAAAAPAGAPAWGGPEKQELIQACVEQVLKVLKQEKHR